jgi:hypothetical protein
MVFVDAHATGSDTIRLFVPDLKPAPIAEPQPAADTIRPVLQQPDSMSRYGTQTVTDTVITDKRFLDFEMTPTDSARADSIVKVMSPVVDSITTSLNKTVTVDSVATGRTIYPPLSALGDSLQVRDTIRKEIAPPKLQVINSDCRSFATEDDFYKLRKKMTAEDSDEAMIAVAKKAFRTKCYSTEQVKNLGVLFLKDEARYQFFDVAYPFVHDTYNFSTLEQQLTDEYYRNRFRAMIRK